MNDGVRKSNNANEHNLHNGNFQFANLLFERGEILFSKGFSYLYIFSQTTIKTNNPIL